MININIPIFRSYELDTAFLIEGSYIKENGFYMNNTIPDYNKPVVRHKICDEDGIYHEVSKDYLAIHFPDMLDSQGNKIFASLSENGKGGDVITYDEDIRIIAIYKNGTFIFKDSMNLAIVPSSRYLRTKVIGIQK